MKEGQELEIGTRGGVVELRPVARRYTLEELLAGAELAGVDPEEEGATTLVDWGPDRGSEALPDDAYSRGEITYEDIVSGRDAERRR